MDEELLGELQRTAMTIAKGGHRFERLEVTQEQALSLFPDNPFKQHFVRRALEVTRPLGRGCPRAGRRPPPRRRTRTGH